VTGATGFLGWAVASRLRDSGWRVRAVIRPGSGKPTPARVERVTATLRAADLVPICASADTIIHLAGLTKAPSAERFRRVNVDGTREVAEAARRTGARLVHISSQAVAGPGTPERPAVEDDPPHPITAYAISKRLAEDAVRSMAELRWTILRPSAVYGPGDRAFLPLFRLARMGLFPLVGDPRVSYTLVYVDDVARAVEMAALSDAARGDVFFVGHRDAVSAGRLTAALADELGRTHRPLRIPAALVWAAAMLGEGVSRAGRPQNLDGSRWTELRAAGFVCSVSKAARVLGFEAKVDLTDGLARTARWYTDAGWLSPARRWRSKGGL
jgi:nucleoside-diphosphate-sugar epimerase